MLFADLKRRGLVYQQTSEILEKTLKSPLSFYCGFDPTSDSLHLGSLLPLLTCLRFQRAGHSPFLLLGGATGMIGDPSGKSSERNLLDNETLEKNLQGIKKITEKFVDFSGPAKAQIVNNADWMGPMGYIEFLRDIGKHFSVNSMMAKDSVKDRLENRDQGISYTEFSYMLVQSYDFYYLHKNHNCQLQIGGSDQWGNITAGVELIRRMQGEVDVKAEAYGLTWPLVTKSDGSKFGKSETGNIWLDGVKTSPYQFYQHLLRLSDQDIATFLKYFSLKPWDEVEQLLEKIEKEPHLREAQKSLAQELTELVHGADEYGRVEKASQALFSGDLSALDKATLLEVFAEVPSQPFAKTDLQQKTIVDFLVESKLCTSKGAARKDLKAGAIYLNGQRMGPDSENSKDPLPLLHDSVLVARRGKKNYCLLRFE